MAKRAAIYGRISDVKKSSDKEKVPAQVAACQALAATEGYDVVAVFSEADGTSATSGAPRPQFEALLALINAGGVDVVLATETERLIRSEEDGMRLRFVCAEAGAVWHMVRGGVTDVASASGDLTAAIKALIGGYESRNKADRQKATYARLRHDGLPHPGPRLFGWKEGRMKAEPVEAQMVAEGSAHIIGGGSVYALKQAWNKAGVLTGRGGEWTAQSVRQVLTRPKNCGRVVEAGQVLDVVGKWDHLVSAETFDAVVATFEGRATKRVPEPRWLSTGIARCGVCGAAMRTTRGNGQTYARCERVREGRADGQRHVTVPMATLEEATRRGTVDALFLSGHEGEEDSRTLEALALEQREVRSGVQRLVQAVAEGGLSIQDVALRRRELEARDAECQRLIAEVSARNARAALIAELKSSLWAGKRVNLMDAAKVKSQVRERFESLPLAQARALVESSVAITVLPGRGPERVLVEGRRG